MSKSLATRKCAAPLQLLGRDRRQLEKVADADSDSRMSLAREVRLVREKTGLSQPQFAARFRIGLGRLRDFEQARSEPDFIVRVFLRMILENPAKAERLIKLVERQDAVKRDHQ